MSMGVDLLHHKIVANRTRIQVNETWIAARRVLFGVTFDRPVGVIQVGTRGDLWIPNALRPLTWRLFTDQGGTLTIDLWRDTFASFPPTPADTMTAGAPPILGVATSTSGSAATWDAIDANDVIRFNVNVVTFVTRATLIVECSVL